MAARRRVFVNYVDTPVGAAIAQALAAAEVGATARDEEEEEEDEDQPRTNVVTYQVVGTTKDPKAFAEGKPKWLHEQVKYKQKEDLKDAIFGCDHIIYNIAGTGEDQIDQAAWAASTLFDEDANTDKDRTFVCLSSVMSWAKTKPADPDDPDGMINEDEYRRRRPHMNYRPHVDAEKLVIKCGKKVKHLKTYVVAAGLIYGGGELVFHHLFKSAWQLDPPELLLFGDGQNMLPTIHIKDLSAALINVVDNPPEPKYILALDESSHSLEEITRSISETLGNGKVKQVSKEDALMLSGIEQADFDMLTANIRLESTAVKEMNIEWTAQEGIVENMAKVVKEYREARNLLPLKVCVLGPPASGKSTLARELCSHYKLHHLHTQGVIDEALQKLRNLAGLLDLPEGERPEDTAAAEEAKAELESLQQSLEDNGGRYEEEQIIKWFRAKLYSVECRNQGYVLDGFPKTEAQAKELFVPNEDEEDEEVNPDGPDPKSAPEFVFALSCSDEFLKERIMQLPEDEVAGTHNTEDAFLRRLAQYRSDNTEDSTVLNYFDFAEIHPVVIEITPETLGVPLQRTMEVVGEPHNYGPTPEEQEVLLREQAQRDAENKAIRDAEEAEHAKAAAERAASRQAEWDRQYAEVKRQEKEALDEASLPLRNYLMKHVMPTLSQGLVEVSKTQPDDPIDFLAEYLFKHNPQID